MSTAKLLSLWQPWAAAVVTSRNGVQVQDGLVNVPIKQFETRKWKTAIRGRVLIHAALKWDKNIRGIYERFPFDKYHKELGELAFGAIIGSVEIIDCITSDAWITKEKVDVPDDLIDRYNEEFNMGDFSTGRFAWQLANPVKFIEPIPFKGVQTPFVNIPLETIPESYHHLFIK